jgi:hypothetical protein
MQKKDLLSFADVGLSELSPAGMSNESRLQRLWDRLLESGLSSKVHGHKVHLSVASGIPSIPLVCADRGVRRAPAAHDPRLACASVRLQRTYLERAIAGVDASALAAFRALCALYVQQAALVAKHQAEGIKTDNDMGFAKTILEYLARRSFRWKGNRDDQVGWPS